MRLWRYEWRHLQKFAKIDIFAPPLLFSRHFYALARRITVEGGNQPRVKVANVICLPLQSNGYISASRQMVNKIEWNKFHFLANLIAFKMNKN